MFARFGGFAFVLLTAAASALAAQQGRLVTETEPNDSFPSANVFQLGDTISGFISALFDREFFAFDVPAGAKIQFELHGQFCPGVAIYDPNQTIVARRHCYSENADTLYLLAAAAGRYYVRVKHDDDLPSEAEYPPRPYKVRLSFYAAPPGGLGNPMTLLTNDVNEVRGMVAAPNGDMFVQDQSIATGFAVDRILRVTPEGQVTTFASGLNPTGQIAIDAFGDLLVPSWDQDGVVWRYDLTTGARTVFTGPPLGSLPYYGITIGADGDVWLSTPSGFEATFFRFDALGTFKGQVSAGVRTDALTTAQNGELFYLAQNTGDVYRLANNATPVRVISAPAWAGAGVALDQDGWVYLYQMPQGKLVLYSAQHRLAGDPLAQVLDSLGWKVQHIPTETSPAWMRDRNGKMTSRLLVARGPGRSNDGQEAREILEVNHRGMGAPGADPMLHLKKKSLRHAAVNVVYADTLGLEEAGSPNWTLLSGLLPPGLSLSSGGVLSGTPTTKGTFAFAVRGANGPRAVFGRFSITVGDAPPVQVSENDIANALMGGAALPAAMVQYLDNLGNKNGRLDVGDFRAYLRSQGQLSGAPKP